MLTKEQRLALPKKRANRQEIDAYYALYAAMSCLVDAAGDKDDKDENGQMIKGVLADRAKLIPRGYNRLRFIEVMLKHLLGDMFHTFEPEKQRSISKQMEYLRIKTVFGPQATRDPEMFLMPTVELGLLVTAATEACKVRMCRASECRQCQLGKVLDSTSFVTRGDKAWWEVFEKSWRGEDASEEAGQ